MGLGNVVSELALCYVLQTGAVLFVLGSVLFTSGAVLDYLRLERGHFEDSL